MDESIKPEATFWVKRFRLWLIVSRGGARITFRTECGRVELAIGLAHHKRLRDPQFVAQLHIHPGDGVHVALNGKDCLHRKDAAG